MTTRFTRLLFAATGLLALTACGPAAQAPQPGQQQEAAPRQGGVFRANTTIDPYDWDLSYNGKATGNGEALNMAYNSLLGFKAGADVGYNDAVLVPELAEKWEVSPDAKTFTFHLRKG